MHRQSSSTKRNSRCRWLCKCSTIMSNSSNNLIHCENKVSELHQMRIIQLNSSVTSTFEIFRLIIRACKFPIVCGPTSTCVVYTTRVVPPPLLYRSDRHSGFRGGRHGELGSDNVPHDCAAVRPGAELAVESAVGGHRRGA